MEYPPAWDYIPIGEMHTASFRGVDKAAGLTVYLEVTGQAAGAFRIALGGGEILEARIDGTSILGESFKGKTIPKATTESFRIRIRNNSGTLFGSGSKKIQCLSERLNQLDSTICKRFYRK